MLLLSVDEWNSVRPLAGLCVALPTCLCTIQTKRGPTHKRTTASATGGQTLHRVPLKIFEKKCERSHFKEHYIATLKNKATKAFKLWVFGQLKGNVRI